MTTIGRGRGRGWAAAATTPEPALRRPGTTLSQKKLDYGTLLSKIGQIDCEQKCDDLVVEVVQITTDMMQKESLRDIINTLYQYAINDKDIQQKIMLLYDYPAFRTISQQKHACAFSLFFVPMQEDYKRRNELRQEDVEHFRNVVSLLCVTYFHLKNNIRIAKILEIPFADYMQMLLETAALEDIEIVVEQLAKSGRHFQAECPDKVDQLMCTVRETVMSKNICSTSCALLLYTIDLANHGFNTIPSNLQKVYAPLLGNTNLMRKQHNMKGLSHEAENEEIGNDRTMIQRNQSLVKNNAVPRAIRGVGATQNTVEHSSSSKKPHSLSSLLPKNSSNRRMWENDGEVGETSEGYYYSEQ